MPRDYYEPSHIAALQNAAQAYLQGLQNREQREESAKMRREVFLREQAARAAERGDVGLGGQLDVELGLQPQRPTGFGSLLPQTESTGFVPRGAQSRLAEGLPTPEGFASALPPLSAGDTRALQQRQGEFERENLADLGSRIGGESSGAFMGPFQRFAQEQAKKSQEALAREQQKEKRAADEKYFEDIDRAILDGRVSPTEATKFFQAKRDYVSGKTQELPVVNLREKPSGESAFARLETARNRKTNTLLTALSRVDNSIQQTDDNITNEFNRLNQLTQQMQEAGSEVGAGASAGFIKRINDLYKEREKLKKRRGDFVGILDKLMAEEGMTVPEGFAEEEKPESRMGEIMRKGAFELYQKLLDLDVDPEEARQRVIRDFSYDVLSGEKTPTMPVTQPTSARTTPPAGKIKVEY